MSSSFRVSPIPPHDEIDIIALAQFVWRQKTKILLAAAGAGLAASLYAFLVTPEYSVSSVLRPVAINELDALNRSEVYKLSPGDALFKVGTSLESYKTRLDFFRDNQKLFEAFVRPGRTLEQSFEEFDRKSMSLIQPSAAKLGGPGADITLELNYPKGVDGVAILNGFVSYAIEAERQKVASDMSVIVKNRLNEIQGKLAAAKVSYSNDKQVKIALLLEESNLKRTQLEDELKALRSQLKNLRLDRISQLDEAIGIARSLSIYKPTTPSSMGEPERSSASVMRTEINNQQVPLYFMGVEALSAEKVALQRRTSDDFADGRIAQISKELQLLRANREVDVLNSRSNEDLFLSGVQSLYAESARLQSVNVDMMSLKLVTIDKYALEPLGPTKPKRLLVILLGLAVGLILGIGIATAAFFVRRPNNAPQNFMQIADLSKAGKTDH